MPVSLLARGPWLPHRVRGTRVPSTRVTSPELDAEIDRLWHAELAARPGRLLFDGPMSRLESLHAAPDALELRFSDTSYKPFFILHMKHPALLTAHPHSAAKPLGLSAALVSADRKLLIGRRSPNVAYHPNCLHPFAGNVEPHEAHDPFLTLYRELLEELSLTPDLLLDPRLLAVIEDPALRQPEIVMSVRTPLTAEQVRARLDPQEHTALVALPLGHNAPDEATTPVCHATLTLAAELPA